MKIVKIYDSYPPIYSDNQNNGELTTVHLKHREVLDESRYTLFFPSSALTQEYETNLDENTAYSFVVTLYEDSKNLGASYNDILINLEEGYAELSINLNDGRILHRVIFTKDI